MHLLLWFCSFSLLETGCRSITVESYPADAKIIIDDVARNEKTPHTYSVRHFTLGYHKVEVEMDGYKTQQQKFKIGISAGDIVWSVFIPFVLFKNIIHDHWKDVKANIRPFELMRDLPQANLPQIEEKLSDGQDTISARLKQLDALRNQNLITEEEYKAKRQSLLDKL